MTFIFFATILIALVVICLLWPLLSQKERPAPAARDIANIEVFSHRLNELKQDLENGAITDAQFQQYRLELEAQALTDIGESPEVERPDHQSSPFLAVTIVLFIPLLSLSIYLRIGSDEFAGAQNPSRTIGSGQQSDVEFQTAIAALERNLAENPGEVEGRLTLAHVYAETGRYADAVGVYEELLRLRPEQSDVMVNYAEALARSHGNRLGGKPAMLLNQALEIAPEHGRALWLAGFAEMEANNKEQALVHWRRLLDGMESGSEIYMQLQKMLTSVEADEADTAPGEPTRQTATGQSIQVNVSLSAEIEADVDPETTLFVFARAAQGPPMPLAVHRGVARDIPFTVTLDESMAMIPQMSLSHFNTIVVGARLSSNGQPQGQSGDYQGFSDPINLSEMQSVNVVVNSRKP